ncbi:MAG: winged helix-turn-helix domain-containing protein, partial [Proteobacteria bacterium]|nr:winged helix-turn-helix domain-containing protein [Pseudomonadota bacterium]
MISRYLGPFRLDEQDGILYKDGQPTALGRRATAVLRYLIDRQGLVVNKDRLIAAVWPGLSVEENNLTVQIATLRRVLGTVPGGEAWIKTLPRRGYQYVGPLSDEPVNNQTALPEQAASGTPERRPVTALLCEMIFSGVDADTLDLDDLRDAVRAFSGRVHEIVQRYHGLPVRHLGSRVLVLFGYPVTRERDAEQAVRAALEICAAEGEPRP